MLNYKQLFYFKSIVKFGGVTRAAEQLNLTPQTISGQLSELEQYLGLVLFHRKGRRLELTAAGSLAYSHANEIFQIGNEMEVSLKQKVSQEGLVLRVGISDFIPKSIAYRLLSPTQNMNDEVRLLCLEGKLDSLFADLAIHKLDIVISDRLLPTDIGVKGFNHILGESGVAYFAAPELVQKYRPGFPDSLNGAPMLIPSEGSSLRLNLERWLAMRNIVPHIKGEFADTALMKAFGQEGVGVFPAPLVIAEEISRKYGVGIVGEVPDISLRFYAISTERKLRHPAIVAISEIAQHNLFAKKSGPNHP